MRNLLSFTGLAAVAIVGLALAPSESRAGGGDGFYVGGPRFSVSFQRGGYYGGHGWGGYGYGGYGGGYYGSRGYSGYGGGYYGGHGYYSRPAVVHPEWSHWTPGRGWHTHGHIHVPHRRHYHTIPY
jgi:hypothetical protein